MLSCGEVPPQAGIGVHFHERSEVVWFSLPTGSDAAFGGIQIHRPQGDTTTLPPLAAGATTFAPVGSVSLDSQSSDDSLQHGYHRLTGFSGCSRSLTNPVRWCDSSSLATPLRGGTMGLYEICVCVTSATWRKARASFPRKGAINCGDSRHHSPRAKGPSVE